MAELVGDDVWRQAPSEPQRRARLAELIELQAIVFAPTLPHDTEVQWIRRDHAIPQRVGEHPPRNACRRIRPARGKPPSGRTIDPLEQQIPGLLVDPLNRT